MQAPDDTDSPYAERTTETREAVVEAVRLRLRSDVPLAFCMSGGVDSNTLIATARRVLNCQVHGFTIVNTDARYDEQALVDLSVRELGIRHTAIRLEQRSFLDNLRRLVAAHDAPVYTISYYVQWQLMAAIAAEGYKVTISGTGADELFTGYYDHHNLYLYEVPPRRGAACRGPRGLADASGRRRAQPVSAGSGSVSEGSDGARPHLPQKLT